MNQVELQRIYEQAYRAGKQTWYQKALKGDAGYLRALDNMLRPEEVAAEYSLGIIDIPINKIVGTYTHARSISFAHNFMPIMPLKSEFASKWIHLYQYHIEQGIADPIKVYEYLNRFFVIEGNKRVSVLKFVKGTTISGQVIRLVPKRNPEDKVNRIYYEFMNFYKNCKINSIWFSEEGRFNELLEYVKRYRLLSGESEKEDADKRFLSALYRPFRQIYKEQGGDNLEITTGDAFLTYLQIYDLPQEILADVHTEQIKKMIDELKIIHADQINVQKDVLENPKKSVLTSLTDLVTPKKQIKAAFVYAKSPKTSGWAYAHELGRLHIEDIFKEQLISTKIENIPENEKAYDTFKSLAEEGFDIIFATSPTFLLPALKAAMEYPQVKFFNCAGTHSYKSLTLYFGRIHEPRYLLGMIAGAMTKTNVIGYVAPCPISEVVSSINAFTLGARAVNPEVRIKALWTNRWDNPEGGKHIADQLLAEGADIISNEDLPIPGDISKTYGVYKIDGTTHQKTHYAMAIWNWGVFYEQVIHNILSGTWKSIYEGSEKSEIPLNFWQGMNNGIVDVLYSNRNIDVPTKHLVEAMKKAITQNEFEIFAGPIYDQNKNLRVANGQTLQYEDIIRMDWLIEGVEGSIPDNKALTPVNPFSYMKGLTRG